MSIEKNLTVKSLLGYKLKKTQHALRLRMDEALKSIDLTTPQYAVLAQLELEKKGLSNAELARRSFITAQTMHGIITNMQTRGLLIKKTNPSNNRILLTTLTKKGQKLTAQAHSMILECEKRMLSSIPKDQQILLENLLLQCFDNLNNS